MINSFTRLAYYSTTKMKAELSCEMQIHAYVNVTVEQYISSVNGVSLPTD